MSEVAEFSEREMAAISLRAAKRWARRAGEAETLSEAAKRHQAAADLYRTAAQLTNATAAQLTNATA